MSEQRSCFYSFAVQVQQTAPYLQDQTGSDKQPINVTAYCAAYEIDLVELYDSLSERFGQGSVTPYPEGSMDDANLTADRTPDVLHARYSDLNGHVTGDIMLFEVRPVMVSAATCM